MIFESALKELRNGKKIRHPYFDKDEYLIGCYRGLPFVEESFEDKKSRGMSIAYMKGDYLSPKMHPKFSIECDNDILKYPQLNLLLIMSDDWEILE